MRDIKFRVFSGGRMVYGVGLRENGTPYKKMNDSYYELESDKDFLATVPLMQYTGLKDKNGVEIYENDIIEWNGNIFPVTVDDFHGYRFNYGKDLFCRAYAEDGKVIGNLYEHPQLTEVK